MYGGRSHDLKIEKKKVSQVDCDGRVTWPMREVTTLTLKPLVGNVSAVLGVLSEEPEWGTPNEKKLRLSETVDNQLLTLELSIELGKDLLLDETE